MDTLLTAFAPTPVAQTAVAIGSDCVDLTNDDDDDDFIVTGSRMVGHAIDTNPRQRVSQVNAICIESESESDVPPPRRIRHLRAAAASSQEQIGPARHYEQIDNEPILHESKRDCDRKGEDRRRCLSTLWSNPNARRTFQLIAWSWFRSLRPDLVAWTDPSNLIAVRGPRDTNALSYDGSVIDDRVFLWHMTPQSAIQKLQLFYLSSIRLWHTRCHHHECARVFSRLIPNWIIAFGCGLVTSQQQ
jgi:hypothetical protein